MSDIFARQLARVQEAAQKIRDQKEGVLYWTTGKKERIVLPVMETFHLFNTLKMCVNQALPYHLRVNDFHKKPVKILGRDDKALIAGMFKELASRDNLTEVQLLVCAKLAELARNHL